MSLFSYSVLSIDGGGIRGIIPCMILEEIEKRTGKPIAESFDLMAGTSTGGMLSAALNIVEDGKIKKSANSLLGLYKGKKGKRIFKKTLPGGLNKALLLFGSQFGEKPINSVLDEEFGQAKLSECYTNILITSYNTEDKKPFYFQSRLAKSDPKEDFLLKDVARATSAAPTYFPPTALDFSGRLEGTRVGEMGLVDGGVFANNPSVLAYVEAIEMFKESDEYKAQFVKEAKPTDELATKGMVAKVNPDNYAPPILLLSIGTGATKKPYHFSDTKGWGLRWLLPLIDIFMQGVSESVHYQMEHLLPPYTNNEGKKVKRYYRLNIDIDREFSEMDDTSKETLDRLEQYGRELIDQYDNEIDEICRHLKIISKIRSMRNA
jgi:patatin-like phospholipase/acyl hydrolase